MKCFDTPRMERVDLVKQDITAVSYCSSKMCTGHKCDACDEDDHSCMSVSPCTVHTCGVVSCPYYEG